MLLGWQSPSGSSCCGNSPMYGRGDHWPPTVCTPGHSLDFSALLLSSFHFLFSTQLAPRYREAEPSLPLLHGPGSECTSLGFLCHYWHWLKSVGCTGGTSVPATGMREECLWESNTTWHTRKLYLYAICYGKHLIAGNSHEINSPDYRLESKLKIVLLIFLPCLCKIREVKIMKKSSTKKSRCSFCWFSITSCFYVFTDQGIEDDTELLEQVVLFPLSYMVRTVRSLPIYETNDVFLGSSTKAFSKAFRP